MFVTVYKNDFRPDSRPNFRMAGPIFQIGRP